VIGLLSCDAPLTPDEGEAHEWIVEELSHHEYSNVPNPIARWFASLVDWFWEALSWKGQGTPPVSLIFMILGIIAVAAIIIVLILNPIRLSKRVSPTVFEEEASEAEAQASFDHAVASQDWDLAYVWAYRLMVLDLDAEGVVTSAPGLTAREAAQAATRVVPMFGPQLDQFAQAFDKVRYGRSDVSPDQVEALRRFTPELIRACHDAEVAS